MSLSPTIPLPATRTEIMPSNSARRGRELSLLRTACSLIPNEEKRARLDSFLPESLDWKSLLNLADQHGVQPMLYQALADAGCGIPEEEKPFLNQSQQCNLRKTLLLSRELIRIVGHLSGFGLEVMPYKGLALAEFIYGDIALRQPGDIDLLIRPADFRRIREAVGELGYIPHDMFSRAEERAHMKSGYECAFDGPAGRNLLEVQWALQPRFYAMDFDMAGLFARATTVEIAGFAVKTPSAEDLLLVLSAHAAKHVYGRLIWLCDLARIVSRPTLNWDWIRSQAHALGIVRLLRVTLLAAHRILDAVIPTAAKAAGLADPDSETLAFVAQVERQLDGEIAYDVESTAYFRLMMRMRERPIDRFRFLRRLLLTPGPREWKAIHLPAPLFPLYRVVRLSRLAARLARFR